MYLELNICHLIIKSSGYKELSFGKTARCMPPLDVFPRIVYITMFVVGILDLFSTCRSTPVKLTPAKSA